MKQVFIAMALAIFVFSSCGTKSAKTEEYTGTHTHADGTIHEGNEHMASEQEAFEVLSESKGCCSGDEKGCTEVSDSIKCCSEKDMVKHEGHGHSHE